MTKDLLGYGTGKNIHRHQHSPGLFHRQVSCALRSGCLMAITRDHHFQAAPIVAFTPDEFINAVVQG